MTDPRFRSLVGRGAGMAIPSTGREFRLYVYRGDKPWVPGEEPRHAGPAASRDHAAERRAEFARLRAAGWDVREAGRVVGVAPDTAVKYERRRRQELGGASA